MKAIVICYNGPTATEAAVVALTKVLSDHTIATTTSITRMDDEEVASALLLKDVIKTPEVQEVRTPEDNAIIFLGNMFEEELGKENHTFATALVVSINKAKKHPSNKANKMFMNAMFILSQPDLNVSTEILSKYKFNEDKIAIVRDLYNMSKNL